MKFMKKILPIIVIFAFLLFGLDTFLQSRPDQKNERVYKTIQTYSPYYLDKRFGGLQILSKENADFKEKPTNASLFREFSRLEKEWGKQHLKVENNTLIIFDNTQSQQFSLPLQSKDEREFILNYYGL